MPNIAPFHPQIVHFVIALLFVGLALRIVSLTGRLKFTSPAATTLLLIGTVAAWLAVRSGTEAHGPVERIPGARDLVVDHERHGKTTLNFFFAVAAIELVALGLGRKPTTTRYTRLAHVASAVIGVLGATQLYEAAEHGGQIVYSYGGGPGLRTNDPKDTERLLLAGLYNQSRADRRAGRLAESAALVDLMAKRFPGDTNVGFLRVESLSLDSKDYPRALAVVDSIVVAPTDARMRARQATLKADIYLAMGNKDSARATLTPVAAAFPQNVRLQAKLDSIK